MAAENHKSSRDLLAQAQEQARRLWEDVLHRQAQIEARGASVDGALAAKELRALREVAEAARELWEEMKGK
ncbi:MAG: hypothetical protein JWL69_1016 [Phycisphaerales bacterium]|jgi:hypothetical protein|nr:hypothetical protein [Phycisphaerales bacterium]MDB5356453.1 hypothetical protein [Phycisphaerales bacterium]